MDRVSSMRSRCDQERNIMSFRSFKAGRLGASAACIAVSAFIFPALAMAQQAAPETAATDQGIVVTGIRASLDASASLKRRSPVIVESISAEDIGKLPDVSIADSLARLPGVTAQRLEGRDQRLSIRGLGPDFGTTLLNGREQVTVGDNRGVEYDQYPSEFFKNVVVYKSANAGLIAAGVSGTVDLRMLRPLAQKDRIIALQVRGQMNGIKALNPDRTTRASAPRPPMSTSSPTTSGASPSACRPRTPLRRTNAITHGVSPMRRRRAARCSLAGPSPMSSRTCSSAMAAW
jgi:outer membrane receptor protein involved in Fe transport